VALVGESGSGKSVTALSILQLLPYPAARITLGRDPFNGGARLLPAPRRDARRSAATDIS
jgi:microcin C transport system ATP-binding protein